MILLRVKWLIAMFRIISTKYNITTSWVAHSTLFVIAGPVGSIIYADLYGSIKIKFQVLIPMRINKDLCGYLRIYAGSEVA